MGGKMPLTDRAAASAKPTEKDYKLSDEKGLFLLVTQKGMSDLATGGLEQVFAGHTTLEEVYYKLSS